MDWCRRTSVIDSVSSWGLRILYHLLFLVWISILILLFSFVISFLSREQGAYALRLNSLLSSELSLSLFRQLFPFRCGLFVFFVVRFQTGGQDIWRLWSASSNRHTGIFFIFFWIAVALSVVLFPFYFSDSSISKKICARESYTHRSKWISGEWMSRWWLCVSVFAILFSFYFCGF